MFNSGFSEAVPKPIPEGHTTPLLYPLSAQHFLLATCTHQNIASRVFGSFAATYADMSKAYEAYFVKNCYDIIQTKEFEEYFKSLEDEPEDYFRTSRKLRDMIRERLCPTPRLNTDAPFSGVIR